jgi:hypothetical protein
MRLLRSRNLAILRTWVLLGVALTVLFALALVPRVANGEEIDVPAEIQVGLVVRVAAYDRNLIERAHGRVLIWVVVAHGNVDSERVAGQLAVALRKVPNVAALPITVRIVEFASPAQLVEQCRRDGPTLLYLSAGLSDKTMAIARALDGIALLTVAAVPRYVDDGTAVLGIELRSGKPALVVHLEQARRHRIAFKPELLRLARVIR